MLQHCSIFFLFLCAIWSLPQKCNSHGNAYLLRSWGFRFAELQLVCQSSPLSVFYYLCVYASACVCVCVCAYVLPVVQTWVWMWQTSLQACLSVWGRMFLYSRCTVVYLDCACEHVSLHCCMKQSLEATYLGKVQSKYVRAWKGLWSHSKKSHWGWTQ